MRVEEAYDELRRRLRESTLLASCAELLGWDELTYLPPGGAGVVGEQRGQRHGAEAVGTLRKHLAAAEGGPQEAVTVHDIPRGEDY